MRSSVESAIRIIEQSLAPMFALFFLLLTACLAGLAVLAFLSPILRTGDLIGGIVGGLNMAVVAFAVYELAQSINDECGQPFAGRGVLERLRRGVLRFVGVACSALVLQALIMVIKYTQKELVGFLHYPVAILIGAGVLLMSLGAFARLTARAERPVLSVPEQHIPNRLATSRVTALRDQ